MFSVHVDDSPVITVAGSRHEVCFAMDGSHMNPLEGFYATLAGCAAVYAKKSCLEQGISAEGIEIDCKPFAGAGGALALAKFQTRVRFPEHFSAAQRAAVIESIGQCAVKKIVQVGGDVSFVVSEF